MVHVTIDSWEEGLNKVQLNHLLRQHKGLGLGEAKRAVDALLAGQSITFEFDNSDAAIAFARSVSEIGAVCSLPVTSPE